MSPATQKSRPRSEIKARRCQESSTEKHDTFYCSRLRARLDHHNITILKDTGFQPAKYFYIADFRAFSYISYRHPKRQIERPYRGPNRFYDETRGEFDPNQCTQVAWDLCTMLRQTSQASTPGLFRGDRCREPRKRWLAHIPLAKGTAAADWRFR